MNIDAPDVEEKFAAYNRKIRRDKNPYLQFYFCASSQEQYQPLALKICNSIEKLRHVEPVFIPDDVTSSDQLEWLAESIPKLDTNEPIIPVVVGGFAQEVRDLLQVGNLDYVKEYYAHTQAQGRCIQPGDTNSNKISLNTFLKENNRKIVVFNAIIEEPDLIVVTDQQTINAAEIAYISALQGDFATTIPEEYTMFLENEIAQALLNDAQEQRF